jgi:hydroxymethylpyrimidine pyrophosphatase-like HAD family hydrolase
MVPNCVKIESSKEEFVYPQGGESQDDFIGRCISSSEMMGEFPDDSQRAAVCYSYWEKKGEFSFLKVSFDYDGVLTTEKGRNLLKQEIQRGNEVYIVSARNTAPSELQELVRELSFPPTKVYTVGSNINKIERIKSLGIERHYDDNLNVRRELGQVGINFDYDVSSLPDYQTTSGDTMEVKPFLSSDCGCSQGYELSQEQVDVFGYLTKNFDLCPGAISLFTHLTEMNMDEDTKGMVRSLAQIADNVFDVERLVMIRGYSAQNEIDMVKVLVGDFTDLLGEINELVGMNHDGSFMYDHLQLIESLYDDPSTWDEEERELFNSIQFLKENHPEKFEAVISGLNGATKQEVERRNHETPTNYFRYDIKVNAGPPDRSFCTSIEGRYFRRLEIDLLRDTNTQFGHNGQPYSKWLYKGGPLCKHAFRKFLVQGKNFADLGWVEGRPGIAPREMTGKGFYPGTPKYEASLSKNVISRSYMDENKFTECFGEFCNLEFTKTEQHLFKLNKEQRMLYTPLMIPNLLIPRMSENGDKYFVKFTPDAVERIQRKFMIEQRLRDTNYEHSDKKFQDIVMVESWLVNGEQDKSYTLGFTRDQIPVGTWMAGYKVLDTPEGDIVWNDYIKPGKVRGASVEGNFILNFSKERTDDYLLDEIIKILNKISE